MDRHAFLGTLPDGLVAAARAAEAKLITTIPLIGFRSSCGPLWSLDR